MKVAGGIDGAGAVVKGVATPTNTADESEETGDKSAAAGAVAAKTPNGIGDGASGATAATGGAGAKGTVGDDGCVGGAGVSAATTAASPGAAVPPAASPSGGDGGGDGRGRSREPRGRDGGARTGEAEDTTHQAKDEERREAALATKPLREVRRRQTHGLRRQTHEDGNTDDISQVPTLSGERIDGGGGDGGAEDGTSTSARSIA